MDNFEIQILEKITNIENLLNLLTNSFVIGLGILAVIFVLYIMYKILDNFISF